ncbi:MAG: STAS domain-containing protein [Rhodococcus fascians]
MTHVLLDQETEVQSSASASTLVVSGDIDLITAPSFARRLSEALEQNPHVELDMSGVTFFSSAGVDVLASVDTAGGRTLTITSCPLAVGRTLDVLGWPSHLRLPASASHE